LRSVLCAAPPRPLASLLNTGQTSVDFETRRIVRDVFWKGSFARDTLLGWEERVRTGLTGASAVQAGAIYAGGSFWKRFDGIENGVATGHVVNYEVAALPGVPLVEEIEYPDDDRRYFEKGDRVLLLRYANEPYRIVYDVIKVIDEQHAIGVMHLGEFPRGVEFATFVMARHNYPFELMSIEDHHLLFGHARARPPEADHLTGTWTGRLLLLARSGSSLLKRANPVVFTISFRQAGAGLEGRYRFGLAHAASGVELTEEYVRVASPAEWQEDLRVIDTGTLLGRRTASTLPPALLRSLENFVASEADRLTFSFVLSRN
jgi:hypothetical protein